jgi:hypothetical protein
MMIMLYWPTNFVRNIGVLNFLSFRNKVNRTLPEGIKTDFLFLQGSFDEGKDNLYILLCHKHGY